MKTIALYVFVGFSGIIFVFADKQEYWGCDSKVYVQYLPMLMIVFTFQSQ